MSGDVPKIFDQASDDVVTFGARTPFEFLQVNGFIYRCNTTTGEMWRLEVSRADKKSQVWKKVDDVDGTA